MRRCFQFAFLTLSLLIVTGLVGADPAVGQDQPKSPPAEKKDGDTKKTEEPKKEEVKNPVKAADDKAGDAQVRGDVAWMLISAALVMLMVPGLALFYGGMVRRKNVLATMMQSMICLSVVGVFWIGIGYSLAFGDPWITLSSGTSILGWNSELVFLQGIKPDTMVPNLNIPVYLHMVYQGMFAIITPALISGALAERIRFRSYLAFILVWMVVVYCPLAQCVWAMNWNFSYAVLDDAKKEEYLKKSANKVDENSVTYLSDAASLEAGKKIGDDGQQQKENEWRIPRSVKYETGGDQKIGMGPSPEQQRENKDDRKEDNIFNAGKNHGAPAFP